jgi:transcriptional regulator with XRE-family HTH domain
MFDGSRAPDVEAGGVPERLSRADAAWWHAWLLDFGATVRAMRELLGLSQEQLAKIAGVSQGAVSRIERGNALSTPLIIGVKIRVALAARLRNLDAGMLTSDARRFLGQMEARYGEHADAASPPQRSIAFALLPTSELRALVRSYSRLPAAARATFRRIMSAVFAALAE